MDSAAASEADTGKIVWRYERRRPERTLLYQFVAEHYPRFLDLLASQDRSLPPYVQREFDDFVKCGILEYGFLRVRCQDCRAERLVAFSCKRRGFCASCGARRMVETAALLVDEVLPRLPMRQWVLSFPFQLRFEVRQPARDHEPGTGPRQPGHRNPADPAGGLRHRVTPAGRGKRGFDETKTPAQRRAAMTWAQRLKRVFKIDSETCDQCGSTVKVIACIEDPAVVKRILDHLEQRSESGRTVTHPPRAPPSVAERQGTIR